MAQLKEKSKFSYQRGYGKYDDWYTLAFWFGVIVVFGLTIWAFALGG